MSVPIRSRAPTSATVRSPWPTATPPVLAVIDDDAFASPTRSMIETLRTDRRTPVVLITTLEDAEADAIIKLPNLPGELTPLVAAVAAQLFSYHLATARGLDPDTPRGLKKVTSTL